MSVDKNTEVQNFDNTEAEKLGVFSQIASDEDVATASAIIKDERKLVVSGDETAEEADEVVGDRIEAAIGGGDDCGCECGCS